MGQVHTGQCTQALAQPGQAGQAPRCKAQYPLRCQPGLSTVLIQALCILGKVLLGLCRKAGEGLRSIPAGGTQQQPTPAEGSLLSALPGLMQAGCWAPVGSPRGAVGAEGRRDYVPRCCRQLLPACRSVLL